MRAIAVLATFAIALGAAHAESLKSSIQSSSAAISKAMLKKDFAALTKAMKASTASNFVYTENGQNQNIDQVISSMKMGLSTFQKVTVATSKTLSLKESAKGGVATTEHKLGGTVVGQDKKKHTMTFIGVSEDTYVKQGGKWKLAKMIWKSQKMLMDGKPMDPSQMGGG